MGTGQWQAGISRYYLVSATLHILVTTGLLSYVQRSPLPALTPEPVCYVELGRDVLPPDPAPITNTAPIPPKTPSQANKSIPAGQQAIIPLHESSSTQAKIEHIIKEQSAGPVPSPATVPAVRAPSSEGGPAATEHPAAGPTVNGGPIVMGSSVIASPGAGNGLSMTDMSLGVGSGPSFRHRVLPAYPLTARRFNKEGKVILRLTIDEGGALRHVEVLEDPGYGFAAAAVEALKRSSFTPASSGGKPMASKAILPVSFALQESN